MLLYRDAKCVDVLLFVEHRDRELEITCAVAALLRQTYGLRVAIASLLFHPVAAAILVRPKVVVTPSTAFGRGSAGWLFHQVYGDQISFVNMNYEQFISSWKGKYKSAKHAVSLHSQKQLVWGRFFADFLVETGTNPSNIHVTGRPLASLLRRQYRGTRKRQRQACAERCGLDPNSKWLFFALTDGLAFIDQRKIDNIIGQGAKEQEFLHHVEIVKQTLTHIIEWLRAFAEDQAASQYEIIVRPHPSVSTEAYQQLFIDTIGSVPSNVVFTKELTAHAWLVACDRYYTNYSTLAMDAKALNVPTHILRPVAPPADENYWWCSGGIEIESFEGFRDSVLSDISTQTLGGSEDDESFEYHIDTSKDGIEFTAKRLSEFADTIGDWPRFSGARFVSALCNAPRRLIGSLLRMCAMLTSTNPLNVIKLGIVSDAFTAAEVAELLEPSRPGRSIGQ